MKDMATTRRSAPQTGPRAARGNTAAKKGKSDDPMEAAIEVDGTSYVLGDLTLSELSELEDHTGLPMELIGWGSAKTIMYVVYLVRRRNDPDYTLEDAGNITIRKVRSDRSDVAAVVGDEDRPTEASSD